jgi:hypothetical protein
VYNGGTGFDSEAPQLPLPRVTRRLYGLYGSRYTGDGKIENMLNIVQMLSLPTFSALCMSLGVQSGGGGCVRSDPTASALSCSSKSIFSYRP